MTPHMFLSRLVTVVRVMLGVEFVVNGLNWWVKLITPYPSISDYGPGHPPNPTFVGAMIATGFLFHIVKATELAAGIALLADRFVPLALAMVFPVTLNVFFVDVFISHHLRSFFNGAGTLTESLFLMSACLPHYATMLTSRTRLAGPVTPPAWLAWVGAPRGRAAMIAFGLLAAGFGAVILCSLAALIIQHFHS